jgi:aminopeptidase-like protein
MCLKVKERPERVSSVRSKLRFADEGLVHKTSRANTTEPESSCGPLDGESLHAIVRDLFPITRSITGNGLRETLSHINRLLPLKIHEVATGTSALDWEIPEEWNIRGGRIETLDGTVVVDFAHSNLHIVGYSIPVDRVIGRDELARHVHTLPDQPTLIPYRTGYYAKDWGFCLAHDTWEGMKDAAYRVVIDSTLAPGSLTYGEALIVGDTSDEVLISVHCCHPSLANDNLSGIAVALGLARRLLSRPRRLSYRLLFIPATIGSLAWLSRNEGSLGCIRHGLVLTCLGDKGQFHYKQSRQGTAEVDRAVAQVLMERKTPHTVLPFSPYGYDERQYCSPGFDLPVGCFMRSPNGTFPEYHTSADNIEFVRPQALQESVEVLVDIMDVLDSNKTFSRIDGRGEPQLGRRGLYRAISGQKEAGGASHMALLWVLNLADGHHSLLDMANRSGLPFRQIRTSADLALEAQLVREADPPSRPYPVPTLP